MTRLSYRLLFSSIAAAAVFAVLGGVAEAVPAATPAASCSPKPYAYAGLYSNTAAPGIEAIVTAVAAADVPSGHVAGWIGVGGTSAGPGGQAEWLQTGVNTEEGGGTELYAEITQPGQTTRYLTLAAAVVPGSSYSLVVARIPGKPGVWQVLVDGKSATGPIYLPGSNGFQPMAMSESWNGGASQDGTTECNGFDYRFDQLRIATKGGWKPLTDSSTLSDQGYKIIDRTSNGFTALSA